MKKFWYKPQLYKKELITAAIECGIDAVYTTEDKVEEVRSLAKVTVISTSKNADMVLGRDVVEIEIDNQGKEKEVEKYNGQIPVIIKNKDWTIIPLENLISKTANLIQTVYTAEQARIVLETLEKGADGVLLVTDDISEIKKAGEIIRAVGNNENLRLQEVEIVAVEPIGMGTRVCVDTTSNLKQGEGLLCGDSSAAFFLVYNENVENPYCDARPFRVNAGAVHAYIRIEGGRTKYLGELKTGDKVLVCNHEGNTRVVAVGRAKIEERPMMVVRAKGEAREFTLVMQNAETIRLTAFGGSWLSVPKLKKGDRVLAYIEEEHSGRHFGRKVKESILEK